LGYKKGNILRRQWQKWPACEAELTLKVRRVTKDVTKPRSRLVAALLAVTIAFNVLFGESGDWHV
jgi:hypothetical protein